jgi:DNA polymerase III gamma/tau subunit
MKSGDLFWPEIGQDSVISFLSQSIVNQKLAHTYIFLGSSDLGKNTLALSFANNLLRSDPNYQGNFEIKQNSDLYILEKEEGKKNISIAQVREWLRMLSFGSFLNSYKIGIIKEADLLSLEAKSALLKTLEEPAEKVIMILLVNDLSSLPATIISRSQVIRFYPLSYNFIYNYLNQQTDIKRSLAKSLAALSKGKLLLAKKFLADLETYQQELAKGKLLLEIINVDNLYQRRVLLEEYFSKKTIKASEALDLLLNWQILWRDLLLVNLNVNDLVVYQDLLVDLKNIKRENFSQYYQENALSLRKSIDQIEANVIPINAILNFIYKL